MVGDYAALRHAVRVAGLLERAYAYYVLSAVMAFGVLAAGVCLINAAPGAAALLIAFGSVQVALIGHDAGHLAIFNSQPTNHAAARLCWTLTLGVCFAYWNDRHTRHHASPNHTDDDPDLQWEFGPGLIPLMAFTLRLEGWRFALRSRNRGELALLMGNAMASLVLVATLGLSGLATLLASQVIASIYLALVVAPNHLGMPTWSADKPQHELEVQLRSSRNVLPHPIADFIFGGLNYQIEHHLFPSMPRTHLPGARRLVKSFCAANGLPYTEESVVAVYRTVLTALPHVRHQRV